MSWAYGIDENGREVGYGVRAQCDEPGCLYWIDRGLYFKCGGTMQLHGGFGCGNFFCDKHRGIEIREVDEDNEEFSPELCVTCGRQWLAQQEATP